MNNLNALPVETTRSTSLWQIRAKAELERRKRASEGEVSYRSPSGYFIRNDRHFYTPGPGQTAFHESSARFKALVGGRGSGKSTAGAQEALGRIFKGQSGAVINPDFENFKLSTWPEFKRWIPWSEVVKSDRRMGSQSWEPSQPFVIHFTNGANVYCKGLKDPDSARGPNLNWLWYDEGQRDRTGMAFKIAIGGVRVGESPSAWVTMTPAGKRHWTYELFVKHHIPEEVKAMLAELGYTGPLYEHFHASIRDNRDNLDPIFYASMLSAYVGKFAEQELEGLFIEMAEGVVFDTFTDANITEVEADPFSPTELAYDDGYYPDPRAILFIQKTDDAILIFDEIFHKRHLAETCVKEVVGRYKQGWPLNLQALDDLKAMNRLDEIEWRDGILYLVKEWPLPTMAVGGSESKELQSRFNLAGITPRGGTHNIVQGVEVIRRLICDTNQRQTIKIHRRCVNLLSEIQGGYRYPDGGKKGDVPVDKNNHGIDALRYWCWSRAGHKSDFKFWGV